MSSINSIANFVASKNAIEVGNAVAAKVIEIDQQAAAGIINALQTSQANLAQAAADIAKGPPLDGTGAVVDRSV